MNIKLIPLIALSAVILSCSSVYHSSEKNEQCEVLLPSIAENYEGYCKKGLAHGEGAAAGLHSYQGEFRDGYPHGEGTYTWHDERQYQGDFEKGERNGFGIMTYVQDGEEKVAQGFWVDGELAVPADEDDPYKILIERGVVSANLQKSPRSQNDKIRITVTRNGETVNNIISGFNINTSSGVVPPPADYLNYFEVNNVTFPVLLNITYTIPNLMQTASINNQVDIQIFEPGYWEINLDNK